MAHGCWYGFECYCSYDNIRWCWQFVGNKRGVYLDNLNSPQEWEEYRGALVGMMLEGTIMRGVRCLMFDSVMTCSGWGLTVRNVWELVLFVAVFDGKGKFWEEVDGPYMSACLRLARWISEWGSRNVLDFFTSLETESLSEAVKIKRGEEGKRKGDDWAGEYLALNWPSSEERKAKPQWNSNDSRYSRFSWAKDLTEGEE